MGPVWLLVVRVAAVLAASASLVWWVTFASFPAAPAGGVRAHPILPLATAVAIGVASAALLALLAPVRRALHAAPGEPGEAARRAGARSALWLPGRIALVVLALSGCLAALLAFLGLERGLPSDVAVAVGASGLACGIAAAMASYALVALALEPALRAVGFAEASHGGVRAKGVAVGCGLLAAASLLFGGVEHARSRAEAERRHLEAAGAALERAAARLAASGPVKAAEVAFIASGAPTAVLSPGGSVAASFGEGAANLSGGARPSGSGSARMVGGWRVWREAGAFTLVSAVSDAPLRQGRGEILGWTPWLGLAVFAALASLVVLVVASATLPLRALEDAAGRIASGDLTLGPPLLSRDEIGQLTAHVRRLASALAGVVADAREASGGALESSRELGEIGARVREGAREERDGLHGLRDAADAMHRSMATVCDGAGGLADYLRSTSSAGSEMAVALEAVQQLAGELERRMEAAERDVERLSETGRRAQARLGSLDALVASSQSTVASVSATLSGLETSAIASQLAAAQAAELADRAGGVVQEAVAGIDSLRAAVGDAKRRVTVLGRRSDDIAKILDFIGEVAGRTNLLSLNASIIATQAGEHGKAFAVVADQIRELAAQISSSTKSIGDIIRAVRDDVNGTARLIDRGDELAGAGVAHAGKSLDALDELRSATSKGHETAAAILQAVQQHGESTRDVSNLVGSVGEHSRALFDAVQLIGKSVAAVGMVSRGAGALADKVSRALEERSSVGRRQLELIERIEAALAQIRAAAEIHGAASRQAREGLEELARIAEQHGGVALDLATLSDRLGGRSRALADRVARFKI